jgi:hypothetical protein
MAGQRSNQLNYVPSCFHRVTGKPSIFPSFLTVHRVVGCNQFLPHITELLGVNGQETVRKYIPTSPDREAYDSEHLSMPRV